MEAQMAGMRVLSSEPSSFGSLDVAKRTEYHKWLQKEVVNGNQKAVEDMIAFGLEWKQELTPVKHNPIHTALENGDVERIKFLLGIKNLANEPNCFGETPLHLACRRNMGEVVKQLLDMGVDKDARDKEEGTPLFHAVYHHSMECIQLLIKEGCDLDALTFELMTPMDQAQVSRHRDIVALLLQAGCTVEKLKGHIFYKDHMANSFFCALWESGDLDNMNLFLQCGYCISPTEMRSLKRTCHQLRVHKTERDTLEMLRDVTERPQQLTTLCRMSIRRILMKRRWRHHTPMETMIGSLPVPNSVKQFLMMYKSSTGTDDL